jgi:beta-glucosidase
MESAMSWDLRFPETFLFGAATAAHQVEGDNHHSDWWQAEQAGRVPFASGAACRHWQLFREDFALARRFGHNAHRFSIEWSRIEPEPGCFDAVALAHYLEVVDELHRLGLEPIVTLQHFTLPRWFAARGGWLARDSAALFARYVEWLAGRLAHRVRFWITINEPTVWAKHAFVRGDWPPNRQGEWRAAAHAILAMARAHRRAFAILHRHRPDAMVGIAHSAPFVEPARPAHRGDRFVAFLRELALNRLPLALVRRQLDFLGVNYYTRALVFQDKGGLSWLFGRDWPHAHGSAPRRFSDMGWEIYPEGLEHQLRRLARLGLPLLVTENGLATTDETLRTRFLEDHLAAVARALAAGVPVLGYLWWSLFDNFEWDSGFAPRFGLFETDYTTFDRRPRPVAFRFAEIIQSRRLKPAPRPPVAPAASASPMP